MPPPNNYRAMGRLTLISTTTFSLVRPVRLLILQRSYNLLPYKFCLSVHMPALHFWCHNHASKVDKLWAPEILCIAAKRFRDELQRAGVENLGFMTSHHWNTGSTHVTLRGFNREGCLRFTSHLRGGNISNGVRRDSEVWLYRSPKSGGSWAPVRYKKPGATVKILPQVRESRIKFSPASYQRILVDPLRKLRGF